jgi:sugar phosphate isomerase/epimerase
VTLRDRSIDEVAALAAECGLEAIEWGGDVHVPPGDRAAARRARDVSAAAGIEVASYGSYAFVGGPDDPTDGTMVLDTAVTLGAANVRVWAGFGVAADSDDHRALAHRLHTVATQAADRGLTLALEFHGGTPTATVAGTLALLDAVGAPNLSTYWQPPYWRGPTTPISDAAEIAALGARLSHLHVYEWEGDGTRRPLAAGADRWTAVFHAARALADDRVAFLEFVAGDDPAVLRRDATTLRGLLHQGGSARG